jgi:cell division protease FtsH
MSNVKPTPKPPGEQDNPPVASWRIWVWLAVLLAFGLYWLGASQRPDTGPVELTYTEFKQALRDGRVKAVTFEGEVLRGHMRPPPEQSRQKPSASSADTGPESELGVSGKRADPTVSPQDQAPEIDQTRRGASEPESATDTQQEAPETARFTTRLPPVEDPELLDLLERHEVTVQARSTEPSWWLQSLVSFLPWILILGLIFYVSYRMQQRMMQGGGPGGGLLGFGKSKAKRFREESTGVHFEDVAGADNAKRDLTEIIEFLKEPEKFRSLGAKVPKGILLLGPPGTGKTLLAKAVAGEADVPFYSISGSEFIEMFVGVGAARVRDMFESARAESPAIIFIDEIDSVGRSRGTGLGGGHDEREQTLNQILNEMDGFLPHEAVVVLAATNRPDVLDRALLRPGRFDRKVALELPQREARRDILEVHTRDMPLAKDVDLEQLAAKTVGFSGADLENLVNEAALFAGREGRDEVDMDAFNQARDKIVLGAERESGISDEDKRVVAYHEAGHALLASLLPHADPLDKVTIIPRGRALGATEQMPEEERYNLREGYLRDRIAVMLGGRIAESVVFGELSTGSEQDLKQATRLARRMVSHWGMSEKLGPVAFRRGEEHVFLGREMAQQQEFSEHIAEVIDEEIQRLVRDIEANARERLEEHRDKLDQLAELLLEQETAERAELEEILGRSEKERKRRTASGF